MSERGSGKGEGFTFNVPLPPGSGGGAYEAAMDRVVAPALRAFQPQLILVRGRCWVGGTRSKESAAKVCVWGGVMSCRCGESFYCHAIVQHLNLGALRVFQPQLILVRGGGGTCGWAKGMGRHGSRDHPHDWVCVVPSVLLSSQTDM